MNQMRMLSGVRTYIPALEHQGAASWGHTQKEALQNLRDAVDLLFESLLAESEEIDLESLIPYQENNSSDDKAQIQVSDIPLIAVTV